MRVRLITRRQAGAIVLLLAVLTPLVGCSRSASQASPPAVMASSSEAPAPTATPRPSTASPAVASPAEQLTPSATLEPIPSGLPADIEHAMRQRQLFGLRSDLAWVQQVAADPRAQMEALDFPMLPEEEAEFGSRQRAYEAAVEVIQRYAASHVDQFGGVYTDQPNHVVVTLWTDDPEGHLADLNKLGAVAKPIVARQVRWSERELRAVQDQVDWDWFSEVDAGVRGRRRHRPQRGRDRHLECEPGRASPHRRALRRCLGDPTRDARRDLGRHRRRPPAIRYRPAASSRSLMDRRPATTT